MLSDSPAGTYDLTTTKRVGGQKTLMRGEGNGQFEDGTGSGEEGHEDD
jgi:hypothetical protein